MKFVFEVKVKSGCEPEQYIDAWQKGSAIIQQQPGALGTRLHKKIGEDGTFLAIASWTSKEARDKAMQALQEIDEQTRETLSAHERYGDIKILGFFEESEWAVDPNNSSRAN